MKRNSSEALPQEASMCARGADLRSRRLSGCAAGIGEGLCGNIELGVPSNRFENCGQMN